MRVAVLLGSLLLSGKTARAENRPSPERFARSLSVGASLGVGGPRGLAGAFVELRPWRAVAIGVGAGLGGSFGPGFDATLTLTPIATTGWALGGSASISRQIMWSRDYEGLQLPPGRALPSRSDWASLAVVNEFRPSPGLMLRLSAGRSWMLDTASFHVATAQELSAVGPVDAPVPGATPLDAIRAASRGETLGVWFVQLDIAPSWRW